MTYPPLLLNSNNRAIFTYRCFVCIYRVFENLFFLGQSQTMLVWVIFCLLTVRLTTGGYPAE